MTIKEYCELRGISQIEFAEQMDTTPQQVTKWINRGCRIYDGWLLSPKRTIIGFTTEEGK